MDTKPELSKDRTIGSMKWVEDALSGAEPELWKLQMGVITGLNEVIDELAFLRKELEVMTSRVDLAANALMALAEYNTAPKKRRFRRA